APGANPPEGVLIHFWLKDRPKARPRIEILDGDRKVIRTLGREPEPGSPPAEPAASGGEPPEEGGGLREEGEETEGAGRPAARPGPRGRPDQPGLQRVGWDLKPDSGRPIKGARIDSGGAETGPRAVPSRYTIKLIVDGQELTAPVEVKPDPRVQ